MNDKKALFRLRKMVKDKEIPDITDFAVHRKDGFVRVQIMDSHNTGSYGAQARTLGECTRMIENAIKQRSEVRNGKARIFAKVKK